jgi:hypothetical protein
VTGSVELYLLGEKSKMRNQQANAKGDRENLFSGRQPRQQVGRFHDDAEEDETAPLKSSTSHAGSSGLTQVTIKRELEEQDKVLDALHSSVTRLGAISEQIHEEITVQDRILSELEEDVTRTDARVNEATRRTNQLIRRNESNQYNCALMTLVLILMALVLWILFGF